MKNYKKITVHNSLDTLYFWQHDTVLSLQEALTKLLEENPGKELNWLCDASGIEVFEVRPETDAEFNLRIETTTAEKRKQLQRLKVELGEA